jgi:hypothetical protein
MANWYSCYTCNKVVMITGETTKCQLCGSQNGEVLAQDRLREGMEAGAIFDIDSTTGKLKKKPRRVRAGREDGRARLLTFASCCSS